MITTNTETGRIYSKFQKVYSLEIPDLEVILKLISRFGFKQVDYTLNILYWNPPSEIQKHHPYVDFVRVCLKLKAMYDKKKGNL